MTTRRRPGETLILGRTRRTKKGAKQGQHVPLVHDAPLFYARVQPFGDGLALITETRGFEEPRMKPLHMQTSTGVWIRVEVRAGQPVVVAVESLDGGPPITSAKLRIPIDQELRAYLRNATVRLEKRGRQVVGVLASSLSGPGDLRSLEERVADVDQHVKTGRRGRPPLDPAFLAGVEQDWQRLRQAGRPATLELAREHGVSESTIRQWRHKARRRATRHGTEEHNGNK